MAVSVQMISRMNKTSVEGVRKKYWVVIKGFESEKKLPIIGLN
jgi:hypothetical protein